MIKKLSESPRVSKMLKPICSTYLQRKYEVKNHMINSLRKSLYETKATRTQKKEKKLIHNAIKHALLSNVLKKYGLLKSIRSTLSIGQRTKINKGEDKWGLPKQRRPRKDRLSQNLCKEVKEFFLNPDISRQVPCKK